MSASFRIKSTIDGRADHSATTGLVNSWTVHHGGQDLQRTRQPQCVIRDSTKIPPQGTSLVDSTRGHIELWLGNGAMEGQTKQIALTSSSMSSNYRVLLHTYRGSTYLTSTVQLIFIQDAWDAIDGTNLAWFTTRQIDGKLRGTGVVSPYERSADPFQQQINALLEKTKRLPGKRGIGQGSCVSVSGDGNVVACGAPNDDYWAGAIGAVWIWVRVPAALNPGIVQAIKRGSTPVSSPLEARAFNRLFQSMQLAPSQDDIDQANQVSGAAPLRANETVADRHLPLQGAQWLQVAKLVGSRVIEYNSSQGFSCSLRGDGQGIIVGGPSQNRGAGGVWWFQSNEQDGWSEVGSYVNGSSWTAAPSSDSVRVMDIPVSESSGSVEMLGCSVSAQPYGPFTVAGGRGLICVFELTKLVCTVRLPEWAGRALSVDTNNLHVFVGCADADRVWVFEWVELLLANPSALPAVLQVLSCPSGGGGGESAGGVLESSNGFGSALASTWMPHRLVVGAHRWDYLAGAALVYAWGRAEQRYVLSQVLSDTESPAGSVQGQGCSVDISGQNGLTIMVGHMLSTDQRGGCLQWLWSDELGKFAVIPRSLVPRNVAEGALVGCSVACSARGDTVVLGCAGDGVYGSAAVFQ